MSAAVGIPGHRPTLSPADFGFVRELVRQRAAIVLEEGKEYFVEMRLEHVARDSGFSSIDDLVAKARMPGSGDLQTRIVEALTTNETHFFRDAHVFDALKTHLWPDLLRRRPADAAIDVWSAGCSTGQEPYSIAMTFLEAAPSSRVRMRILATDLCAKMVAATRAGRYGQLEVDRGLPPSMQAKYVRRDGAEWVMTDEVRRMVEARPLNLIEPWPPLPRMDVIFLRNVLIYFDIETKRAIFRRIREVLRPDGCLFLGGAESPFGVDDAFERAALGNSVCYRLRSTGQEAS